MLLALQASSLEELFKDIPKEVRYCSEFNIPALAETQVKKHLQSLADLNFNLEKTPSFLGGGIYRHFIPSAIQHLLSRSEFYTAYTPYQAEVSQGTLQTIFEYQTVICQLTGMDVSNASMYDGASAVAEAALMAHASNGKKRIIIPRSLHPEYRRVLTTYTHNLQLELEELPLNEFGQIALNRAKEGDAAALIIQNPNFLGVIEPVEEAARFIHERGGFLIYAFSEAISLGLLPAPGLWGADIVAGEGQSLGIPPSLGGPGLGILAAKESFLRRMPGRLIGEAKDAEGKRAFVMILQTREQHIRRERASSNICTNHALCALTALIYLSLLGERGFRQIAEQNYHKAHFLQKELVKIPGISLSFPSHFYNEFTLRLPAPAEDLNRHLWESKVLGGISLKPYYPELGDAILLTATEANEAREIELLLKLTQSWARKER